ncbi:MAG: L,D-transpeptidase family protein [Rhodomicrobiaceae bacterium]
MNTTERGVTRRIAFLLLRNTVFPIGVLISLTSGSIAPASAENSGLVDRYAAGYTAGHEENEATLDPLRSGPLIAVVSIADQHISIYGSGGLLARATVSTGVSAHPTPTGVFAIVQKQRWHRSNIYSGAPMPLMQRITWSGIALHAGYVPGYPASHGCIRLPPPFAQRLFGATVIGERVIVTPVDIAPIEITHKTLPAPILLPAPNAAVSGMPDAPDAIASVGKAQQNGGAVLEPVGLHDAPAGAKRLNPLEFAQAMKKEANRKARSAAQATKTAMLVSTRKSTELRMAARKLAAAENTANDAAHELAVAIRRLDAAANEEAIAKATEAKAKAEAALTETQKAEEARIARVADAKSQAEAALTGTQKTGDAQIAEATAAKSRAEAALAEAQKTAEEAAIAEAIRIKGQADAAVTEAQKAREARVAKATKAETEAEEALAEAQKAREARVAKATEAKTEAEEALAEAQKAREARIVNATEAKTKADATLAEAQQALGEARAANDAKQQELADARNAVVEARVAGKAATKELAEATRRLKPLSVFISRKTGRLYVRQDFEPLFDVPVSIRDADREIGTHVYVSTSATEDGSALRWQAVSMPVMAETRSASPHGKGRRGAENEAPGSATAAAPMPVPETAQGALDRVTIPDDASRRLAELAWIGASVIISDYGMSGETDASTDFIILTRPRSSAR